jgi:hypothetical protein
MPLCHLEHTMESTHTPSFQPGDILFFAGNSDLSGPLSRWFTRSRNEQPTYAVHTAQFIDTRTILEMNFLVKKRSLAQVLRNKRPFEVWRRRGLTAGQRHALTTKALVYFGTKISCAKLLTHALDGLINKISRKEVFFFRRLNHGDTYPICSWITAFAYARVLHYSFGVPPECADPDQMHDWVRSHPRQWTLIYRHGA